MEQAYRVISMYQQYIIPGLVGVVSFLGGYASNSPSPHSLECAPEIQHAQTLEGQIAEKEAQCAQRVDEAHVSCVSTERRVCQGKIERFKTEYRALRCQICEQGVR